MMGPPTTDSPCTAAFLEFKPANWGFGMNARAPAFLGSAAVESLPELGQPELAVRKGQTGILEHRIGDINASEVEILSFAPSDRERKDLFVGGHHWTGIAGEIERRPAIGGDEKNRGEADEQPAGSACWAVACSRGG